MFHSARLRLTAWYLFIIMLISLSFSALIYRVLTVEVERYARRDRARIERGLKLGDFSPSELRFRLELPMPVIDPELVLDTKRRIVLSLAIVNGTILVLSGGFGYLLAGRTLKPIKEMIDEQNRFISDSSHELRTPLTSLKTALEVALRDKNLSLQGTRQVLSESIQDVDKLQSLSDELLKLAQYQKPSQNNQLKPTQLTEMVRSAINQVLPMAKKKKITIKNCVTSELVLGNGLALTDLIVILLDNAIKYSNSNSQISLKSKKNDGMVELSVIDHGIGIEKKDMKFIFDRFYRADYSRSKTATSGYGLGLSIAKKIVDMHHGTISVDSTIFKGATFIVKLPIFKGGKSKKIRLFS